VGYNDLVNGQRSCNHCLAASFRTFPHVDGRSIMQPVVGSDQIIRFRYFCLDSVFIVL
jgi:hypothetical protein